jgi:hypothetical protein
MKTNVILYGIIAILGLSLLFAFKQEDKKQHAFVYVHEINQTSRTIYIYKEGVVSNHIIKWDKVTDDTGYHKKYWDLINTQLFNEGYRVKVGTSTNVSNTEYIFEKE